MRLSPVLFLVGLALLLSRGKASAQPPPPAKGPAKLPPAGKGPAKPPAKPKPGPKGPAKPPAGKTPPADPTGPAGGYKDPKDPQTQEPYEDDQHEFEPYIPTPQVIALRAKELLPIVDIGSWLDEADPDPAKAGDVVRYRAEWHPPSLENPHVHKGISVYHRAADT